MLPTQIPGDIYSSKNKCQYSHRDKGRQVDRAPPYLLTQAGVHLFTHMHVILCSSSKTTGQHYDETWKHYIPVIKWTYPKYYSSCIDCFKGVKYKICKNVYSSYWINKTNILIVNIWIVLSTSNQSKRKYLQ